MDIALLSKMVGELILENDQVGLPGVGTFVAEMVPASFSDKGFTINPPYRRIVFHPNCLEDTLLRDFYCKANSDVDAHTAKVYLNQYLSEVKEVLMDRRSLVLPGLGRLRLTRDNNIFFVPDENLDIFPAGFGLEPVSLKTHVISDDEPVEISRPRPTVSVLVPDPDPQPEPVSESMPEPMPIASLLDGTDENVITVGRHRKRWWIFPLALAGLAVIGICAFLLLAEFAPDFIDSILYTPEELRIINY